MFLHTAITVVILLIVTPVQNVTATPPVSIISTKQSTTFVCTAIAGLSTVYHWIRGSNPLSPMPAPLDVTSILSTLNIISNDSTLVLESIEVADGGEYTCIAINEAGFDNDTVVLLVRPEILGAPSHDIYIDYGDYVNFTCLANSFPAPTYQWEKINRTTGLFETFSFVNSILTSPVGYNDYGYYRCVVVADGIPENATSTAVLVTGK